MGTPYLGEIRIVAFNFAPKGWALCNGQFMPINQNQALFSILGTTYGGNGQTTFALPDLRGRAPYHFGNGHSLGEKAGEEAHTLTIGELPTHLHGLKASNISQNQVLGPNGTSPAISTQNPYEATFNGAMAAGAMSNTGGSQPHPNMQPYLTLNFCIALIGVFPSRN